MNKKKKTKEKVSAIDKYLIFVFTSVILYTIAVLVIFYRQGLEPTTLTVSFFGLFGGEITLLALIKRLKLKKEDKDSEKDSEKKTVNAVAEVAGNVKDKVESKVEEVMNHMGVDGDAVG